MHLVWLCLLVFFCRIIDVSLATIRTIFTVKGKTLIATTIGFFEILIWFLIVRQALNTNESGIMIALSYAGGFATGTFVGSIISKLLINTKVQMQIITSSKNNELIKLIRSNGFAVTVVNVNSSEYSNEKDMLFIEVSSKQIKQIKAYVNSLDPKAFITVHESMEVYNGFFSTKK